MSDHLKGLLITSAGVLAITPDSLLVRLIAADDWTLLFWRGLLQGIAILLVCAVLSRGRFFDSVVAVGRAGLWFALVFAVGTVFFILSLGLTKVANTLFIVSAAPLFAALISWVFLGERPPVRTWTAIACALFGIAVISSGSLEQGEDSLLGDLCAVGAALSMAGTFSIARHARARSLVPAMGLAGLATAVLAIPLAAPLSVAGEDVLWIALMGLVVLPLGFGLMTLGPRYLPAAEVSLLLLLEAVIGPFWVWLVLGEHPGATGLIGGAIVLGTLAIFALCKTKAGGGANGD
jgi:drug/metabolite transporter (DMT)-like permease